ETAVASMASPTESNRMAPKVTSAEQTTDGRGRKPPREPSRSSGPRARPGEGAGSGGANARLRGPHERHIHLAIGLQHAAPDGLARLVVDRRKADLRSDAEIDVGELGVEHAPQRLRGQVGTERQRGGEQARGEVTLERGEAKIAAVVALDVAPVAGHTGRLGGVRG